MYQERIQHIKTMESTVGNPVIYVMSRDQRVSHNFALQYAQNVAVDKKQPLAVVFVLAKKGIRAKEHYEYMLEGLRGIEKQLKSHNIPFILLIGSPLDTLKKFCEKTHPSAVVFDFSPLAGPRKLIKSIASEIDADVAVVDTHNIVPLWLASDKQEVGARTLRPKIHRYLNEMLGVSSRPLYKHPYDWPQSFEEIKALSPQIEAFLSGLKSNGQKLNFVSGEQAAKEALENFVENRLEGYAELRNKPELAHTSDLSPYLHFGQLSSLQVVQGVLAEVSERSRLQADADVLIEEMVVRKELSDNYCYYSESYTDMNGAPVWAQATLAKHAEDPREFIYTLQEFEQAKTHDPAWNAAQLQLINSGKMHGYMRMYWAKKVLEWSKSAEEAIRILIYLNDFYSLDGGDPNGYTGIMWSVCGVHDRPWGERPIYGTVRSMVYGGLKRKFDIKAYEEQWG